MSIFKKWFQSKPKETIKNKIKVLPAMLPNKKFVIKVFFEDRDPSFNTYYSKISERTGFIYDIKNPEEATIFNTYDIAMDFINDNIGSIKNSYKEYDVVVNDYRSKEDNE